MTGREQPRPALDGATRVEWVAVALLAGVALPLAPDTGLGPYGAINLQSMTRVVLVVLCIGAAGFYAQRFLGERYGLLVAGFAAGFVSSSATIASMGLRAKADPSTRNSAVAGGLASSIATVVFYVLIVAAVDPLLVRHLALPLGFAGVAAMAVTLVYARAAGRVPHEESPGRAFQWLPALAVGGASAALAMVGAALRERTGEASMVVVSAVAGLVDAHATSASVATLHHEGQLDAPTATLAVVVALSVNTVTKMVMAFVSRERDFALRLSAGVLAIALAAWLGMAASLR